MSRDCKECRCHKWRSTPPPPGKRVLLMDGDGWAWTGSINKKGDYEYTNGEEPGTMPLLWMEIPE